MNLEVSKDFILLISSSSNCSSCSSGLEFEEPHDSHGSDVASYSGMYLVQLWAGVYELTCLIWAGTPLTHHANSIDVSVLEPSINNPQTSSFAKCEHSCITFELIYLIREFFFQLLNFVKHSALNHDFSKKVINGFRLYFCGSWFFCDICDTCAWTCGCITAYMQLCLTSDGN